MAVTKSIKSILLIDDDEATNFLHRIIIKESGIAEQIYIVTDGKMALDYLAKAIDGAYQVPGLIILDINMPIMDGWGFLEAYHHFPDEWKANTKVVVLTSSINPADEKKAREYSEVSAYLSKPLTTPALQQLAEQHGATIK